MRRRTALPALLLVFAITGPATTIPLAEDDGRPLPPETVDAMLAKRVENQARWADYSARVTSRLLVDGELELTMVHRATFDLEGRASFELVREDAVKGGIFTRALRNKKRRDLEEWREKLQGVLNYYWAVTAGEARDWLRRATLRELKSATVTELLVEGSDYAIPGDHVAVVRREGGGLPDAFRVKTVVRDAHVEILLTTQELGDEGMKVPAQASVDVAEQGLRLVLRYEDYRPR